MQTCKLLSRTCLRVMGADSVRFLQGMLTNNTERWWQSSARDPLYAAMLNAQGRVLFDVFLHRWPDKEKQSEGSPSFLLECDQSLLFAVRRHLQRYRLRARVDIQPASEWAVLQTFATSAAIPGLPRDPRVPPLADAQHSLGHRWVHSVTEEDCLPHALELNSTWEDYTRLRYRLGIPEGCTDFGTPGAQEQVVGGGRSEDSSASTTTSTQLLLPQESNLDFLHAIDYRKGCYVGQELTIRTHHRGTVRKRIVPVQLEPLDAEMPQPIQEHCGVPEEPYSQQLAPILDKNGSDSKPSRPLGKLVSSFYDEKESIWRGLALLRLDLPPSAQLECDLEHGVKVKIKPEPAPPIWWPKVEQS